MRRPDAYWLDWFFGMAEHVASASRDPSTRVGCVIADSDRRILSVGYNGFPRGVADLPERLADRPTKHLMIVHAEANAVAAAARSGASLAGATAYVTHPPCSQCAALMVQAGIRRVVSRGELRAEWAASQAAAEQIMREGGIEWERVERDASRSGAGTSTTP